MMRTSLATMSRAERNGVTKTGVVVGVFLVALLVALFLPAVQQSREAARRTQCKNQLKQLGLASQSYHETFRSFPPAFTIDAHGDRLHSWRLHLIPYLAAIPFVESQVWEPFTSERNSRFYGYDLSTFKCPSDSEHARCETNYMVVRGEPCWFQDPSQRSPKGNEKGLSHSILISEVIDTGVHWMHPIDLPFDDFTNFGHSGGFRSHHTGGIQAVMADGSVRWFNETTDPVVQRALLTTDGSESIPGFE